MKYRPPVRSRCWPAVALVCLGVLLPVAARAQESAVAKADLNVAACRTLHDGASQAIDEGVLWEILGLVPPNPSHRWSAGEKRSDGKPTRFDYLIVLKKPVAIGSLFVRGTAGKVFLLKPGSQVPSDPQPGPQWLPLDAPPSQSGALVTPLAAGQTTQAVWLVDERTEGTSQIEAVRLFKARWQNVVPAALGYASHEYYRPPADFQTPFLYAAEHVVRGTETWYSSGKGKDGRISTPPISDVYPEWFLLVWDEPHTVRSVWVHGNARQWSLEQYVGPDSINPRVGTPREWRKVKDFSEQSGGGRWIVLDKPLTTRGLRLNITKVDGQAQIAWIDGFHVLEDLGAQPVRNLARSAGGGKRPPFEIPLDLASEDNLTMVVNDASGKRVRNLVARVPAAKGKQTVPWDLKDEAAGYVTPGKYTWQAITCPTLQPRYEFTVYPNVSENAPENPPWLTGANGPGGWLADHCNNSAVCVVGDRVFLAAYMAESGVALIECNLAGHKRWGHPGFADWTGVGQLASDGKTLFNAAQINGRQTENVWAIDIETKQIRPLMSLQPTSQRNRGFRGIAARDGEVILSVSAPAAGWPAPPRPTTWTWRPAIRCIRRRASRKSPTNRFPTSRVISCGCCAWSTRPPARRPPVLWFICNRCATLRRGNTSSWPFVAKCPSDRSRCRVPKARTCGSRSACSSPRPAIRRKPATIAIGSIFPSSPRPFGTSWPHRQEPKPGPCGCRSAKARRSTRTTC